MKLWKRLATLSLVLTTAFFSLFWITAFTTEEVAQLEPGEASHISEVTVMPTSFSKSTTTMNRNEITLRKGSDAWTCLPAIGHRSAGKHPMRRDAV
jgi:hypothetical protein